MKKNYWFIILISSFYGLAQIPAGYYDSATGTEATLKTQLFNIIKNHTDNGYAGLYTIYQTSDIDRFYENDGTIMDMYSENPTGVDPYNYSSGSAQRCGNYKGEGVCYNREHMIPQSFFNSLPPMVSDAHHITPTDGKVNGLRDNHPHGNVSVASTVTKNGGKLGSSAIPGYVGTVFEPINEFKGDIARIYFYFVTRYEDKISSFSFDVFDRNTFPGIKQNFLDMLISWHKNDPVSAFEIERNNAIYKAQNNRNPYIDHPEYVSKIWENQLASVSFDVQVAIALSPNPSNGELIKINSNLELDVIELYAVNGQLVQKIEQPTRVGEVYELKNLEKGFYLAKITTGAQSVIKKIIVQ